MNYIFLIPVSIGLGLTGLGAFFCAMRHDQYDDLAGDAARILTAPDRPIMPPPSEETEHGQLSADAAHPDPDRRL
ncbi:MAG: cbb3-type cytochrome oxidase assembly protein CcoS [Gemmobacter sp.]|uniref:cbb3-type cytochrome oxidase assembly protein CcoS n=1 Tax=Gemmobacter sp. TaxID=1898957 RepID=UPI003918CC8D